MKRLFCFLCVTCFFIPSIATAAMNVLAYDYNYAFVWDTNKWTCGAGKAKSQFDEGHKIYEGKSLLFPIEYMFFSKHKDPTDMRSSTDYFSDYLIKYGLANNHIFSDLKTIHGDAKSGDEFSCSYFSTNGIGRIRAKLFKNYGLSYLFVTKIQGDYLDEATENRLFEEACSLLNPIVKK